MNRPERQRGWSRLVGRLLPVGTWATLLALATALCCARAEAAPPEPSADTRRSIGLVVSLWRKQLAQDAALRSLAHPDDEQQARLQLLVHAVRQHRAALDGLAKQLPPGSEDARELGRFLQDWPEPRLLAAVPVAATGHGLDRDIDTLARRFPERGTWRTLFPLFRP